jgi:hypothetical protein
MPLESNPSPPAARKDREDISVFVSYSSVDEAVVRNDVQWLEEEGIKVWFFQRGIKAGHQNYGEAIVGNLKNAAVVLFYLSVSSNDSDPCAHEAKIAWEENKRIIPIKVDDLKVSNKLRLYLPDYHQSIARYEGLHEYRHKLLSALTGNPAETPSKSGFFKTHRLCLLSLMSAGVGIFILPAGLGALAFGLRALINKRAAPMGQGWIWATRIAVAIGLVQTLVILSALVDGFGRAGVGG